MQSSLSSLVDNLAGVNKDGITCKDCKGDLEFIEIDETYNARYKCGNCYFSEVKKQLNEEKLKTNFKNVWKFCEGRDDCFRLLLRKVFIPMNTWIHLNDLMKHHYHPRKHFIVN